MKKLFSLLMALCMILPTLSTGSTEGTQLGVLQQPVQPQKPARPKPARGTYDLAFDFYDGPNPQKATLIGSDSQFAVPLRNGRFAITLPIPPSLRSRSEVWLNVQAAPGGTGQFRNLSKKNLPVKSRNQDRVSSKLRISGTILDKQGQLVLGPYETVWLLPKPRTSVAERPAVKNPPTQKPAPPKTVLERIQQDLGLKPGQFLAHANLDRLWPLEQFPVYGGNQLLQLLQPENATAVNTLPENLLLLMELPDQDAVILESLMRRENGFTLKLTFTDLKGQNTWLAIELQRVSLREVHRLDQNLYSLRIHPEQMKLNYAPVSTTPVALTQGPSD